MSVKYQCDIMNCGKSKDLDIAPAPFDKKSSAPNYARRLALKMHHILCPSLWKAGQAGTQESETAKDTSDPKSHSRPFKKRPQNNPQREEGGVNSILRQPAAKETGQDTNGASASQRPATGLTKKLSSNGSSPESFATAGKSIDSEAAKREAQCIIFQGDEDSDYTRGPIRIITASDGVDDNCAVLLLNRHFSDSIKAAISARRELINFIHTSQKQDEAAEESRRQLRERIEKYRLRIVTLEAEAVNTSIKKAVAHALEKEMREIHAKVDELEKSLYAEARDQSIRESSLQLRYKDCFKVHELAHQFLEAAFVDAGLLSPLPNTIRDPNSHARNGEECVQRNEKTGGARRAPGGGPAKQRHEKGAAAHERSSDQHTHEDPEQPATTEDMSTSLSSRSTSRNNSGTAEVQESSTCSDLNREYVRTKRRLAWAQWEFDLRDETREREQYWNDRDLRRSGGNEGMPQEEFDLRWVEHNSKLTRQLIDAEEAFKAARIAAVNGGCQVDDPDASSVFEDDDTKGYPPSREAIWKADAPKGMIESWRKSIPDASGITDTSEVSPEPDSQDGDQADLWGSWSVVADPTRQAKIKQWEKACTVVGKKPAA